MNLGGNGENMIKAHEGYRADAYQDIGGVWTIGWGHTGNVYEGMTVTKSEAQNFFDKDVKTAVDAVNVFVIGKGISLNQNQFDALVSLVYNVGSHNIFTKVYGNGYEYGSSLYNLILQKEHYKAAQRFTDFNKVNGQVVKGLTNRRIKEKELFLTSPSDGVLQSVLSVVAGGVFTWYLAKQFGL
jgi:Phage-related lysozyme (muraminidase)